MGYTLIFGKATSPKASEKKHKPVRYQDVEPHPGKTPEAFADYGGEDSCRSPQYGVWDQVVACIPELARIWGSWHVAHNNDQRVFMLDDHKGTILPLEARVDAVQDPALKVRLQWFFYWCKTCCAKYGKRAALYIG